MATKREDLIPGSAPPGWDGGVGVPVNGSNVSRNIDNTAVALSPFLPSLALGARSAAAAGVRGGAAALPNLSPAMANMLGYGAPVAGGAALLSAANTPSDAAVAAAVTPAPAPVPAPVTPKATPTAASAAPMSPTAAQPARKAAPVGRPPAADAAPADAAPAVNMDAFQALQQRGLAQDLGGYLVAGGQSGSNARFDIPWASTAEPRRPGDIEVIRGATSSFATPELGYNNPINPQMYAASLLSSGGMTDAAALQRMALESAASPDAVKAKAQVESATINAAGGVQQAGVMAGGQRDVAKIQSLTQLNKALQIPVPIGSKQILGPGGIPMGAETIYGSPDGQGGFAPVPTTRPVPKTPGQIYVDGKGKRAVYQSDGTFKEVK